jgi:hypothetical protein
MCRLLATLGTDDENIKTDAKEIGWDGMHWINLAESEDKWKSLVKWQCAFQHHNTQRISWLADDLLASLKDSASQH